MKRKYSLEKELPEDNWKLSRHSPGTYLEERSEKSLGSCHDPQWQRVVADELLLAVVEEQFEILRMSVTRRASAATWTTLKRTSMRNVIHIKVSYCIHLII